MFICYKRVDISIMFIAMLVVTCYVTIEEHQSCLMQDSA